MQEKSVQERSLRDNGVFVQFRVPAGVPSCTLSSNLSFDLSDDDFSWPFFSWPVSFEEMGSSRGNDPTEVIWDTISFAVYNN